MTCSCHPATPAWASAPSPVLIDIATLTRLTQLEALMSTATEAIATLTAQADANGAALLDLVADVRALIVLLSAEPQLLAETQAAADGLAAKLADESAALGSLDSEVGDADGSDAAPVA